MGVRLRPTCWRLVTSPSHAWDTHKPTLLSPSALPNLPCQLNSADANVPAWSSMATCNEGTGLAQGTCASLRLPLRDWLESGVPRFNRMKTDALESGWFCMCPHVPNCGKLYGSLARTHVNSLQTHAHKPRYAASFQTVDATKNAH